MNPTNQRHGRHGVTAIETLVSFTLLMVVISATAPLLVHHHRLLADQRAYRLAVDELSDQLDRLTLLTGDDLLSAVKDLPTPQFVGGRLSGRVEPSDLGTRIVLTIDWADPTRRRPPITLVGWTFGQPADVSDGGAS